MSFTSTPRNEGTINGFGTAVASSTIPATLAGSLIVVGVVSQLATGNSTSVTDNIGNTYTMVPLANPGVSQRHVELWYCLAATAGVTAVTVNNAAGTNVAGSVTEWTGTGTTLRGQTSIASTTSASPAAATVSPAVGDLVIGIEGYQASVASTQQEHLADGTYTSLTRQTRGTTTMFAGAYKVVAAATATGPTWTLDTAVATGEITAAFTQAGPGPVAAFTSSTAGLTGSFDASTSTATSPATVTGYAWNFGDSGTGTGVTPSHTYATSGTYTVTLTVTDSNGQTGTTTHSVTVSAPASTVGAVAVVNSTGWTVTGAGGNALTAVSDTDQSTYVVSAANPSAALFRVTLGPMVTPAAGTDMTVTVEADATGASSGTLSAKLYEGATVRATAVAQTLTVVTAGTNTINTLTFTFPAGSIANVTSWNALQLELSATAS